MPRMLLVLSLCVFVAHDASFTVANEKSARDLLPASTVIYAEISNPKALVDLVLDHPLRQQLESVDAVRRAYDTPQYHQFQFGLSVVEHELGMKWREAIESLAEGGIHVAINAPDYGTALLVHAKSPEVLAKARETLLKLVRDDAKRNGRSDPIKMVDYRGVSAFRIEQSRFATIGSWLMVTNKDDLAKTLIDGYLDGQPAPLSAEPDFANAYHNARQTQAPAGWAYFRVKALRDAGIAKELFAGKTENIVAELLVGGIMATLQNSPYVSAGVYATSQKLEVRVQSPFKPNWVPESRNFYFGPGANGRATPLLDSKSAILSVTTYRDLSGLWTAAADLVPAEENAKLAQANSGLTTLFAGRDFGIDVLGSFRPEIQLIVSRQTFESPAVTPEIKLPAAAVVFRLKDPEKMQRQWKVTFQSLIGFLNVAGAMEGQPPLEMNTEKLDGATFIAANYLPPENSDKPVPINFNASPTISFVDDLLIISSTRQLAVNLARSAKENTTPNSAKESSPNTQMTVNLTALRETLTDNESHLITQNMLEKGHDREMAEKEIATLIGLLKFISNSSLQLERPKDFLELSFELDLAR